MGNRVKEIAQYRDGAWHAPVPIGANAENIDVKLGDNEQKSLDSVLGNPRSDMSIQEQLDNKVDTNRGDIKDNTISDGIETYDYDEEETSDKLIPENEEDYEGNQVVVTSGSEDTLKTMWSKFNRFRKRVDNKFKNYLLAEVVPGASDISKGYSTSALNNYFRDVIGYTAAADVQGVPIASQLTTLKNRKANTSDAIKSISRSGTTFTATRCDNSTFTFTQQDNNNYYKPVFLSTYEKAKCTIPKSSTETFTLGNLNGVYAISWYYISNAAEKDGGRNVGLCSILGIYSSSSKLTIKIRNNHATQSAVVKAYVSLIRFDYV